MHHATPPNPFSPLANILAFSEYAGGLRLRGYQREVAQAVLDSVMHGRGRTLVVLFPRQSGKNELQAQLEAYLLVFLHRRPAELVKISPTYKPQTLNAMRRLERVLERNLVARLVGWKKEEGHLYRVGQARMIFLSGAGESHIVGATASTLLEVDEAQDVDPAKYDKDVAPMAASTNATRVFWGTAWTSTTLLARELRASQAAEQVDGLRRVFRMTADDVAAEVPAYAAFVRDQVARLGRQHPLVKTQFFSEEIDSQSGMFPPARRALMQGSHSAQLCPQPGKLYALLLDVAGEDEEQQASGEAAAAANTKRDATALTVVEVDLSTLADPLIKAPRYLVVHRQLWIGLKQTQLYAAVRAQVEHWTPRHLVVDTTGIGAGLASFLAAAFPSKVLPFVFTSASKSQLGWDFLAVIESGRFKDYASCPGEGHATTSSPIFDLQNGGGREGVISAGREGVVLQSRFLTELEYTQLEAQPGPGRLIKWGTPAGLKVAGEYIHDDLVLSAALCAVLDGLEWSISGPSLIVQKPDPLLELSHGF